MREHWNSVKGSLSWFIHYQKMRLITVWGVKLFDRGHQLVPIIGKQMKR
jgi:hypothetical protein